MRGSPGARAYYQQLRDRNIGHQAALRQLANRLVGILHGCLKTRTRYDEHTAWSHHIATPLLDPEEPGMSAAIRSWASAPRFPGAGQIVDQSRGGVRGATAGLARPTLDVDPAHEGATMDAHDRRARLRVTPDPRSLSL